MSNYDRYKKLSLCINELLSDQELFNEDVDVLQDIFLKEFKNVVITCMDYNFEADKFEETIAKVDSGNGELIKEFSRYFDDTVDNEESYIIMNKFLTDILFSIEKITLPDMKGKAYAIMDKHDIQISDIKGAEEEWNYFLKNPRKSKGVVGRID